MPLYKTVSCVVSTWNRVDDLMACIHSILRQDYPLECIEVVVVDNCSIDTTMEFCNYISDQFKHFVYYCMPDDKSSAMVTLNKGFNLATGEYVLVLDDDALLVEDTAISKLVEIMESDPWVFACSANVVDDYGNPNMVISDGKRILTHDEVNNGLGTIEWLEFHGAGTIMRRSIGKMLKWYNESFVIYANEIDLSIRAWNLGYKILYTNEVTVFHNSGSAKPQLRNRFHGYKNILYVIDRYFTWKTRLSMYVLSVGVHTIRMLNVMRMVGIDVSYLGRWGWITLKYGWCVCNPIRYRQFTNQRNHETILNRLWTSYKMFIIGKITGRDLSMYGLTGR